jgi:transposase
MSKPKKQQSDATPKAKRVRYDDAFKRDVVALLESGRSATQLAREMGISQWNLRDWKRLYGAGGTGANQPARSAPLGSEGAASTVELAAELADLRRELEATRRQRDILKKALAIVAQEQPNATN